MTSANENNNTGNSTSEIDPADFGDEIALETSWAPLKKGGTSSTDYKLRRVNPSRIEFQAKFRMYIVAVIFMLMGAGVILKATLTETTDLMFYGMIGLGVVFILYGVMMVFSYRQARVFDIDIGYFWRDKRKPEKSLGISEDQCELNKIHAVQIIQERVRKSAGSSGSSYFFSYEINLVLDDGQRLNVVDHGTLSRIRKDAKELAEFLNVPLWDAIE